MTAGASSKRGAFGFDDRVIGFLDAVPALVAVHGVVAAAHGRDRDGCRQRRDEALDVSPADCGGVSRPSVNACTSTGTPASARILASAAT